MIDPGMGRAARIEAWPDQCSRSRPEPRLVGLLLILATVLAGCLPDRPADALSEVPVEEPRRPPAQPELKDTVAEVVQAAKTASPASAQATAAPDDLARLAESIVIPVRGVLRSQLRDSYSEPRADRVHHALDILAPRRTPVLSAVDGRLLRLFDSKAGGLMVYATDPSERFILLYGHLDGYAPGMVDGMLLKRGQVIGYVGTTGNAPPETPHLHFGILRGEPSVSWSKGEPVNPFDILGGIPPGR